MSDCSTGRQTYPLLVLHAYVLSLPLLFLFLYNDYCMKFLKFLEASHLPSSFPPASLIAFICMLIPLSSSIH